NPSEQGRNHDKQIEQAYDDILNSSKHTLGSMMELQEALLESNQATKDANEIPSASNGDNDEWSEVQRLQTSGLISYKKLLFHGLDLWTALSLPQPLGHAALWPPHRTIHQHLQFNMLPWLNIPSGPVMEGPFDSCVLLDYHLHLTDHDKHLKTLAPVYVGTKFVKLDAENAPFFVAKLAIKILPCVILFKLFSDKSIGTYSYFKTK
ncbi:hypothetical protein ACJX0J_014894, partial [Zea mays]